MSPMANVLPAMQPTIHRNHANGAAAGRRTSMWNAVLAAPVAVLAVAGFLRIHDIQGAAHVSPMAGQEVSDVEGLVTEFAAGGFYLQGEVPDGDDATSE